MALDADQIFVAGNGHLYVAPVGSTAPSDATTAPAAAFVELGYTTEDGATLTPSQTITAIKAWQSFYTLRQIKESVDFTFTFTLMQLNYETLRLAMGGGDVTGSGGNYHFTPADPSTLDERAMIGDFIDGARIHRWYFPRGIVTDVADIVLNRAGAAGLGLTFAPQLVADADPFEVFTSDSEFSAT